MIIQSDAKILKKCHQCFKQIALITSLFFLNIIVKEIRKCPPAMKSETVIGWSITVSIRAFLIMLNGSKNLFEGNSNQAEFFLRDFNFLDTFLN